MFQLKEFEGKETAQLVDRYKFLDLYPCTTTELKSIGYSDVSALQVIPWQHQSHNLTLSAENWTIQPEIRSYRERGDGEPAAAARFLADDSV